MLEDMFATLFHQPFWRGGRSADAYGADAVKPSHFYFVGTLNLITLFVHALALVEQHFAVGTFASAHKQDDIMSGGESGNVGHTVGYLSADGVETPE